MDRVSASKSQVKLLQKLKLKKYRQKYNFFVVEGRKVVQEIIEDNILEIKALYATEDWFLASSNISGRLSGKAFTLSPNDLKTASSFTSPDGVIAICITPRVVLPEIFNGWLLYLDGISDPGNLGTIVRTADWFGISDIVLSPGTVDYLNSKCIQASMGSIARVKMHSHAFDEIRAKYPDCPLILADSTGENPINLIDQPGILVVGSESHGISPAIYEYPHKLAGIQRAAGRKVNSLNAAIATASLLTLIQYRGVLQ